MGRGIRKGLSPLAGGKAGGERQVAGKPCSRKMRTWKGNESKDISE